MFLYLGNKPQKKYTKDPGNERQRQREGGERWRDRETTGHACTRSRDQGGQWERGGRLKKKLVHYLSTGEVLDSM